MYRIVYLILLLANVFSSKFPQLSIVVGAFCILTCFGIHFLTQDDEKSDTKLQNERSYQIGILCQVFSIYASSVGYDLLGLIFTVYSFFITLNADDDDDDGGGGKLIRVRKFTLATEKH